MDNNLNKWRVATLSIEDNEIFKAVMKGMIQQLDNKMKGEYYLEKFFTQSPDKSVIVAKARRVLRGDFDVVVVRGTWCAQVLKEVSEEINSPIPVIAYSVNEESLREIEGDGRNFICVSVTSSPDIIPAEWIVKTHRTMRRVVLACRSNAFKGRAQYHVDKLSAFFESKGISVHQIWIKDGRLPAEIDEAVKNAHAVMWPEGGLLRSDQQAFIAAGNTYNVTVFANGKEAINQGAVFSIAYDWEIMGCDCGSLVYRVTKLKKKPYRIRSRVLQGTRRYIYNPERASACGISMNDDMLCQMNSGLRQGKWVGERAERFDGTKAYVATVQSTMSLLHSELLRAVERKIKRPHVATAHEVLMHHEVSYQVEGVNEQAQWLCGQEPFTGALVVGREQVSAVLDEMARQKYFMNIDTIEVADTSQDSVGFTYRCSEDKRVNAWTAPPPRVEAPLNLFRVYMERFETMIVVVNARLNDMSAYDQAYLDKVAHACQKRSIRFVPIFLHKGGLEALSTQLEAYQGKPGVAVAGYIHLMTAQGAADVTLWCDMHTTMSWLPKTDPLTRIALPYTVRYNAFAAMDVTRAAVREVTFYAPQMKDIYQVAPNDEMIEQCGGRVPQTLDDAVHSMVFEDEK